MRTLPVVMASGLVVIGCVAAGSALLTPPPVVSSAPQVEVGDLQPLQYKWVAHPVQRPGGQSSEMLLIRLADHGVVALDMPMRRGQRLAPSVRAPEVPASCVQIEVDLARRRIHCARTDGVRDEWHLDGAPVAPTATPLRRLNGHEQDGAFLLY